MISTLLAVAVFLSTRLSAFSTAKFGETFTVKNNFFREVVATNPLKAECLIPTEVDTLIKNGKATVKVLTSTDRWFGVTYKEDKPAVVASLKKLVEKGEYKEGIY